LFVDCREVGRVGGDGGGGGGGVRYGGRGQKREVLEKTSV
jgi:hypothetical protein